MMLGDVVRALRLQRGWKQHELARQTGLDQGTISNIENGKQKNPTHDTLTRLADALNIPLDQLIRSVTEPVQLATEARAGRPELARLQRIWQQLPANDRAVLLRTAEALECLQTRGPIPPGP